MITDSKQYRACTDCMIFVSVAVGLSYSSPSLAEKWEFAPSVTLEQRYDDNIRLTTGTHESVNGTVLKGNAKFSRLTEVSQVNGELRLNFSEYDGNEIRDNSNESIHFRFNSNYSTELSNLGLNGIFKRDTTLRVIEGDVFDDSPEVDDPGVDDNLPGDLDGDLDSGLVDVEIKRNAASLSPYWQHQLNERSSVGINYTYSDVSYDDNPPTSGLFDYYSHDLASTYSRNLTERDSLSFSAGVGRFKSPDNQNNTVDSYNLTTAYNRKFSETMKGKFVVGISHAEQESNVFSSSSDSFIFDISLEKNTETDRYTLGFSRSVRPTGGGNLSETNEIRGEVKRKFKQRLNGSASIKYLDIQNIGNGNSNRKYLVFSPRLSWKLAQDWALIGGYRYRETEYRNGQSAESNAVFLSIRYSEPYIFD